MSEYQSRAERIHRIEIQLSIQGQLYTFIFSETVTLAGEQQITGRNLNIPSELQCQAASHEQCFGQKWILHLPGQFRFLHCSLPVPPVT
jgi:hypothetical protein